jgi:hypothetical protein
MRKAKRPRWGVLVGSKKRIRSILTGEPIVEDQSEILADDLLYGAPAIAEYTGLRERQVYHQQKAVGLKRLGD